MEKTPDFSLFYHVCKFPEVRLHWYDELPSTNRTARELAAADAPAGTLVIAGKQTAGRGRLGRSFFSPDATGLYMSLLLRPVFGPETLSLVTPLTAVAVALALEKNGARDVGIKWVNDLFMRNRKVCGILSESVMRPDGTPEAVIIGIGVNLSVPAGGFPADISSVAGAVFEDGRISPPPLSVAAAIVNELVPLVNALPRTDFLEAYAARSILTGCRVSVGTEGEGPYPSGVVLGIDGRCGLLLQMDDGTKRTLTAGEVSVRPTR